MAPTTAVLATALLLPIVATAAVTAALFSTEPNAAPTPKPATFPSALATKSRPVGVFPVTAESARVAGTAAAAAMPDPTQGRPRHNYGTPNLSSTRSRY